MQDELRVAYVDRMSSVVPTLIARHDRHMRRHQIDDLALALVAPLRADDRYVHTILRLITAATNAPELRARDRSRRRRTAHDATSSSPPACGLRDALLDTSEVKKKIHRHTSAPV